MRKWLLTLVAGAACVSNPALAQQRTINDGASAGAIRVWPVQDVWQVALVRAKVGGFSCALGTGVNNPNASETYFWGFRQRGNLFGLVISDRNKPAVVGADIALVIDGTRIGAFPIANREEADGLNHVVAELSPDAAGRVKKLLGVAGSVKFVTSNATYSASLLGVQHSADSWRACLEQASLLSGQ